MDLPMDDLIVVLAMVFFCGNAGVHDMEFTPPLTDRAARNSSIG